MEKRIYEKPLMCLVVMDWNDIVTNSIPDPEGGGETEPGTVIDGAPKRRGSTPWDDQD